MPPEVTPEVTPEDLGTYLALRGFDEDVVQDVLVSYLARTKPLPIKHLKAWAWKAAVRRKGLYQGQPSPAWSKVVQRCAPLSEAFPLPSTDANPLRRVITRQELSRAFKQSPKRKQGRARNGGPEAWREDYQALLNEPR